jgi:hypothetical protein
VATTPLRGKAVDIANYRYPTGRPSNVGGRIVQRLYLTGTWKLVVPKAQWKKTDPVKIKVSANTLSVVDALSAPVKQSAPLPSVPNPPKPSSPTVAAPVVPAG